MIPTPHDQLRETIKDVWREVLAVDRVEGEDSFFRLGGTSLKAAQICARLRSRLGHEVAVGQLLRNPRVATFTSAVAQTVDIPSDMPPIQPSAAGVYPLTAQQEAIWLLEQLAPGNTAYNSTAVVDPHGRLDESRVLAALDALVQRHEALRTSFPIQAGMPVQAAGPPVPPVLDIIEVPDVRELEAGLIVRELGAHEFDLCRPPLIRWTLLRDPRGRDLLVQVEHHFVHDGWSMWILLTELARYYREGVPARLHPAGSYGNFACRQREWLDSAHAARQLRHWESVLRDAPRNVDLNATAIRPAVFTFRGDTVHTTLSPATTARVKRRAADCGVTPFSLLMAAFARSVSDCTRQSELTLGTTLRNRRWPGTAETVGMFVNTVALPVSCPAGECIADTAQAVQRSLSNALDYQDFPFSRVVDALRPRPLLDRNPLFQLCFSMNDWPDPRLDFGLNQAASLRFPANGGAKFDLDVVVLPDSETYPMLWRYYDGVLDAQKVREFATRYEEAVGVA